MYKSRLWKISIFVPVFNIDVSFYMRITVCKKISFESLRRYQIPTSSACGVVRNQMKFQNMYILGNKI